jgi:hypothetical protein
MESRRGLVDDSLHFLMAEREYANTARLLLSLANQEASQFKLSCIYGL